jgi:hypothetical protein
MIRQPVETFWGTAENEQSYQGYIKTTVDPTGTAPSARGARQRSRHSQ